MKSYLTHKKGNGLLAVLIITTAIAIAMYSFFDLAKTEHNLKNNAALSREAQVIVESLIQTGINDIKDRTTYVTLDNDAFSPSKGPLSVNNDFLSFHNTNNSSSKLILDETEIVAGRITDSLFDTVNAETDIADIGDFEGFSFRKSTVEIFGKVTLEDPTLGKKTVYASQLLEIREKNLFSYAIYSNLPLELAPGPVMDIYGPVHAPQGLWVQGRDGLFFHDEVTYYQGVHEGRRSESGTMPEHFGNVYFADDDGELVSGKDGKYVNFSTATQPGWEGNLSEGSPFIAENAGIVSFYVEDLDYKNENDAKEALNTAYKFIEPLEDFETEAKYQEKLAQAEEAFRGVDSYSNTLALDMWKIFNIYQRDKMVEAERFKFAYKAGLTIELDATGNLSYYTYARHDNGDIIYENGSPKKITLTPPDDATAFASKEVYSEDQNGAIVSGLYDMRQQQNMNLVEIDVSKLKDLVHANDQDQWGGDTANKPDQWWTGVVYVKFPQGERPVRWDNIYPAKDDDWAVRLINGQTIPNPDFAKNHGTTIATNQAMYVQGHYNADGDFNTGTARYPDNETDFNTEGHEAPSALVADAITFLSTAWDDANSKLENRVDRPAQATEISTAIMTGVVPSGKTGQDSYSGGIENLPRFLEYWLDIPFRMRGSMVVLYESEIATASWGGDEVYKAPLRQWGYHSRYETEGPVGINPKTYRGRDFRLLTQAEYESRINANWAVNNNQSEDAIEVADVDESAGFSEIENNYN